MNFGVFDENSEIHLYFVFDCFHLSFSSISSIELQNLPKEKLLHFKFSKTLVKGSRAESCYILKYKAVNLGGSFGHLEVLEVQGLIKFSLDYFMFFS